MLAIFATSMLVSAQTVYDFSDYLFEYEDEDATPLGVFYNVSPNGRYAVGCDDAQMNCYESYLWTMDNPTELTIINVAPTRIATIDVSDCGTVVGSFEDRGDDLDTKAVCYPAYRTIDGTWTTLPVPDEYSTSMAKSYTFAEEARAITPDDKYIAGNVHIIVGYNSTWGWDIVYPTPLLWELTDTGYALKEVYLDLGAAGKSYVYTDGEMVVQESAMNYKSFLVYDISRDGTTICGVNTAASGGQNPAIIKDGALYQLFDCGEYGVTDVVNFDGGICNKIDANGNVYGYFVDENGTLLYFVYTAEGKLVYYDEWYITGTADGEFITQSNDYIPYVLDASDDGLVIAGGGTTTLSYGADVNYPLLIVYNDDTGIDQLTTIKNSTGISYERGGNLYVKGVYNTAEIFSASGAKIASGRQGHSFDTSAMPSGTYVVRVTTDEGVSTYKFVR